MVISTISNNLYQIKGIKIYKIEAKNIWVLLLKTFGIALKEFWSKM